MRSLLYVTQEIRNLPQHHPYLDVQKKHRRRPETPLGSHSSLGALPNLEPDSLWQLAILLLLHAVSSLDAVTKHTPQEREGQAAKSLEERI